MQEWFLIIFPAFLLGVLHTAIPCEDKAIFLFWSSGISKTSKYSFKIITLYGLGLMASHITIAFVLILISILPRVFGLIPDPYAINFFGSLTSTFVAIGLLFFITQRNYLPHNRFKEQLPQLNWSRKRTPYFLGLLTGFPPCIFELLIYNQCFTYSLSYGFVQGIATVFYFSLGTFIGLFPLTFAQQGTSQLFKVKETKKNKIFVLMILIIILFNVIVMILSFLRIHVFPVENI